MRRFFIGVLSAAVVVCSLVVAAPAQAAGSWSVLNRDAAGRAVRWAPCGKIFYVANMTGGPSFATTALTNAIRAIEAESGLDFVSLGSTKELPSTGRVLNGLRYGLPYNPVLVSFATAAQFPLPAGMSGWGGARSVGMPDGSRRYVTGQVVLRPKGWTPGISSPNPLRVMFEHELGHIVGLGHVDSTREIMTRAGNGTQDVFGPGDKAGLRALGRNVTCPTVSL